MLCCVSRLLALRVSSHPPRPAIPRILRASRVTWAHALCMQPLTTPLTRALRPSSDPIWEQETTAFCVWMAILFAQPSLWRNVLRLAHSFRASNGTFWTAATRCFVAGFTARTSPSASCRSHSTNISRGVVKRVVSVETRLAPTIRAQRCDRRGEARVY